MRPSPAAVLLMAVAACGQAAPPDPGLVESSDPELAAMSARLLQGLAERAGLPLREAVRVEYRSRSELEAFLRQRLDEEIPEDEATLLRDAYAMLGLVPDDLDLRGLLLSLYGEQVAGFYDPETSTLYVMDDQPADATESVLIHELVHAVQDQATPLDSITDRSLGNDRQIAAQSAIEGHATLVMMEFMMAGQGADVDLGRIPDFSATLRPALESMRSQFPALAAAPRIIQEGLLFPYLEGATFVQTVWGAVPADQPRPAPFHAMLPLSTEQILEPGRFLSEPRDEPTEVRLAEPEGATVLYENDLGAMETGLLLGTLAGPEAEVGRTGWDGDRYVLLDVAGRRALGWFSVWDDAASRDRFVSLLTPGLARLSRPATVRPLDVDGRPGAWLSVGPAPDPRVLLSGGRP